MKKYILLFLISSCHFLHAESGPYIGGQAAIDYSKVDFNTEDAQSLYDSYSSKANYSFIAGYALPTPLFYLAAEYGVNLKSSNISFSDSSTSDVIGREFTLSKMKYIDILPGLTFMLDKVLLNAVIGMERSKLKLSEDTTVNSDSSNTNRKALRLGGAISFFPSTSTGFRFSIVQSDYKQTTYNLNNVASTIQPKIIRATLALIWKL